MKFDIDYIAHNNRLSLTNPYYKLFGSIIIMLITLFLNNLYLDVTVFVLMAIVIMGIARISLKDYLKFISIPFIFTAITSIYLVLFTGTGEAIYNTGFFGLIITKDSLELGIYTFGRVFACFSCLGFLSLTTPISNILHCLGKIKVPKVVIEIALLMYSTIFIFLDELNTMRNAQESRLGYRGTKATYRSLGSLFSNLFLISLDKSEKLQCALDSRGYTGEMPIYEPIEK
ncbi:MAG: cobalt ECF transporter T component CbiQ [Methanobrevibacter sp.]|uniref:cobalt ECF transporter T component CbiQ n=1 Tax=Methanobrevibacter sp. TaxID=66852 RepID=UPI0026E0E28B|nr:cobalt ECF transporter T component CbiQ [Methanobrevibacter sp.]MDO5849364.1 cobalt ECF transporter T component CbiQ [Methanobrevibacter sp.]